MKYDKYGPLLKIPKLFNAKNIGIFCIFGIKKFWHFVENSLKKISILKNQITLNNKTITQKHTNSIHLHIIGYFRITCRI